jgi:glycosyltransferase involved in cell wall biosynthesis
VDISVILATYNQPSWLEKVVWGYRVQLHRAFEIVIADDGSKPETGETIARLRRDTGLEIQHVWQPDDGFRKCRILNQALLAARFDYMVFSDGDCVPRRDFLATHVRRAAPGYFLSGGLVRLPLRLSQRISIDDIIHQRAMEYSWLRRHGLPLNKKCLMLVRSPRWASLCDWSTTTKATWNGHNASGWKADLLRVNGFDERMGYGGEDRELGSRLVNAGVRPLQIRHQAVCVHLEHGRGYVDLQVLRANKEHRRLAREQRLTWTPYGAIHMQEDMQEARVLKFPTPQRPATQAAMQDSLRQLADERKIAIVKPATGEKPGERRAA